MATHVDYEAAWVDLADRLRAKPGWGTKELHAMMAEVAATHRLPEHYVNTVLRLYGGDIHIQINDPETGTPVAVESIGTDASKPPDPGASTAKGGHDGSRRARPHDPHPDAGSRRAAAPAQQPPVRA